MNKNSISSLNQHHEDPNSKTKHIPGKSEFTREKL